MGHGDQPRRNILLVYGDYGASKSFKKPHNLHKLALLRPTLRGCAREASTTKKREAGSGGAEVEVPEPRRSVVEKETHADKFRKYFRGGAGPLAEWQINIRLFTLLVHAEGDRGPMETKESKILMHKKTRTQ